MNTRTEKKSYDQTDDYGHFGTIAQIQEWMKANGVQEDAVMVYDGCGSHNIAFEWQVPYFEPYTHR